MLNRNQIIGLFLIFCLTSCIRILGIKSIEYYEDGSIKQKTFSINYKEDVTRKNYLTLKYFDTGKLKSRRRFNGTVILNVCSKGTKNVIKVFDKNGNLIKLIAMRRLFSRRFNNSSDSLEFEGDNINDEIDSYIYSHFGY